MPGVQEGDTGSDDRTAKMLQQGTQGAYQTSNRTLISRVLKCAIFAGCPTLLTDTVFGGRSLVPTFAPDGDAHVVQGLAYLHKAVALIELSDLLHHRRGRRVNLQRGTLLGTVVDLDAPVAEGALEPRKKPLEAASRHSPRHVLREIFRVRLRPRSRSWPP